MRDLDLEVWEIDLDQPADWIEDLAARWLGRSEHERAGRGTPAVRRRRLVTAIAVRTALGRRLGRDPGSLRFTRDANGKPALAPGEGYGIHFSLSTSAGRGLVALSSHGPVGVDLERVAPLPEFERIASSRFARGETAAIMRLPADRRLRTFYECWTRKEAYLKASGAGLAGGLDSIRVTVAEARPGIVSLADGDAARWTLLDVDLGESFTGAAVLADSPPTDLHAVTPAPLALAPLAL
jgi:4'-phosphopantetheinyl transferase